MGKPSLLEGITNSTKKPKSKIPPNEIDIKRATKLKEAMVRAKKAVPPPKVINWANEFRLLSKSVETERIDKCLNWVINNIQRLGKDGIPPIFSASSFYHRFTWLEEKVDKDLKDNSTYVETPIGKKVMAQIRHLRWRNGLSEQLPAQVEQSITEYDAFMTRLKKWQRDMETMVRLRKMISGDLRQLTNFGYQIRSHLQTAEQFIPKWFKAVWEWAHKKNFNLKRLSTYSFTPTHKQMTQWGTEWASGYGNPKLWEKLMEAINGS